MLHVAHMKMQAAVLAVVIAASARRDCQNNTPLWPDFEYDAVKPRFLQNETVFVILSENKQSLF